MSLACSALKLRSRRDSAVPPSSTSSTLAQTARVRCWIIVVGKHKSSLFADQTVSMRDIAVALTTAPIRHRGSGS